MVRSAPRVCATLLLLLQLPCVAAQWSDDFDSYPPGSNMHGLGGWQGWDNDPQYTAYLVSDPVRSVPNSVDIVANADLVRPLSGYTSGQWVFTAWVYVPAAFAGQSYLVLDNTYNDGGPNNTSTALRFDSSLGVVESEPEGAQLTLLTNVWVKLCVQIDLDLDWQQVYYDGALLSAKSWTDGYGGGGGALNIGAVDLWANFSTSVYCDSLSLRSVGIDDPEVTGVSAQFVDSERHAFYVNGVELNQDFTATIDWHYHQPPYEVHWITPQTTYEDFCTPPCETASRSFNMGDPAVFGHGGWLQVQVFAEGGLFSSEAYDVNLTVVDPATAIPVENLEANTSGDTLSYEIVEDSCAMTPVESDDGAPGRSFEVPAGIPFFGGEELRFSAGGVLDGSVRDDGTIETGFTTPGDWMPSTSVGPVNFSSSVSGSIVWQFDETAPPPGWAPIEYSFNVSLEGEVREDCYVFATPPIYYEIAVGLTATFGVIIQDWTGALEGVYQYVVQVQPWVEGVLGLGFNDFADIEGYVRGGASFDFVAPEPGPTCWDKLDAFGVFLKAGVRAHWMTFVVWEMSQTWTEDLCTGKERLSPPDGSWQRGGPRLIRRSQPARSPAGQTADARPRGSGRGDTSEEEWIRACTFPHSIPDLAVTGGDLLMVWVGDDTARSRANRTELVFSVYDEGTWSPKESVVPGDTTADYRPQLATLANGAVLLAWENLKTTLEEPADPDDPREVVGTLEAAKGDSEIAVAKYSGGWASPLAVTANDYLDRSPRVATADDGTALLTWVSNTANHETGDPSNPNTIHYRKYNGTTWSATANAKTNVPSILKSALAYTCDHLAGDSNCDGAVNTFDIDPFVLALIDPQGWELEYGVSGCDYLAVNDVNRDGAVNTFDVDGFVAVLIGGCHRALLVYSGDTDGNPNTSADRELFAIQYIAARWGAMQQLTNDPSPVEDANPQVMYDDDGNLLIVWYRDGDLYMKTNLAVNDHQKIVNLPGTSAGAADFELTKGPAGRVALVWQSAGEERVDEWDTRVDPYRWTWCPDGSGGTVAEVNGYQRTVLAEPSPYRQVGTADDLLDAYVKVEVRFKPVAVAPGGEIGFYLGETPADPAELDGFAWLWQAVPDQFRIVRVSGATEDPPGYWTPTIAWEQAFPEHDSGFGQYHIYAIEKSASAYTFSMDGEALTTIGYPLPYDELHWTAGYLWNISREGQTGEVRTDYILATNGPGDTLFYDGFDDTDADIWYAVYEPNFGVWSYPLRLTAGSPLEYAAAPVYDGAGDLIMAYNKMHLAYQTETIQLVDRQTEVRVQVPDFEASPVDLYVLRHAFCADLTITMAQNPLSPANPPVGTATQITATVHNLCDQPAEHAPPATPLVVSFYQGDPDAGGLLIGTAAVVAEGSVLVGGQKATVSVPWTVPPTDVPLEIFARVDPGELQADDDRTNNTVSTTVLAADLTIAQVDVRTAGSVPLLTVRVANAGVLPVTGTQVVLRAGGPSGAAGATFTVPAIDPGTYQEVSGEWTLPEPAGVPAVWICVDEADAIAEFDETNNTRWARLWFP